MDAVTKKLSQAQKAKNKAAAKSTEKSKPAKKPSRLARIEALILSLEKDVTMLKARVRELEPDTLLVPSPISAPLSGRRWPDGFKNTAPVYYGSTTATCSDTIILNRTT